MMDAGRHRNIKLITNAEVTEVKGRAGAFKVKVRKNARYVDEAACTACGDCAKVCPVVVPNEFDEGLGSRNAIYSAFPQAVPASFIRSDDDCLGTNPIACNKCAEVCQKDCIDFDMRDEMIDLNIGSIIVATGLDYFDAREASEYGYSRYPDVINSIELERLLSSGGPSAGKLVRFSDQKPPKRVSFIQCVGSRCTKRDIHYCSRICCMNALKSALLIRELYPDIELDIFYIDIRAFGKGFEQFFQRAVEIGKINLVRGKPSKVTDENGRLIIQSEDVASGKSIKLETDMVILSEAIVPSAGSKDLGGILGINTDQSGFFTSDDHSGNPITSAKDGIFLAGCATGPKDITDSITEASGTAVRAAQYLSESKLEEVEEEFPEYDFSGPPRIGIFICHCGSNIAGVLSTAEMKEYAATLPDVRYCDDLLFACAENTQREIQEKIIENNLNRVVVAACTPRTHEPIFQESLRKIGLNPYLLEMINVRDQCSWVHHENPESGTEKAKDLIRMGAARVRLLEPLESQEMDINHDVLVVGGGIAGLETSIQLGRRGYQVYLVEKEAKLGGAARDLAMIYPSGLNGREFIETKIEEAKKQQVKIFTSTQIEAVSGYVGNFQIKLNSANGKNLQTDITAGAIVLSHGFEPYRPDEDDFGYGRKLNVVTNIELENLMSSKKDSPLTDAKHVAFIQCVGSRGSKGHPECSRYCCQAAIKQALALREKGCEVAIFNRDIRIYHYQAENMYRRAREKGVLFFKYNPDTPPKIVGDTRVQALQFHDPVLQADIEIPAELLVLSVGMQPNRDTTRHLQGILKTPLGMDGFYSEKHPKFGPVETNIGGVFIAGCDNGPKDISDSISQAAAAAGKIDALLSRSTILMEPITSEVAEMLCRGCATCVDVCEYDALEIIMKDGVSIAEVNQALCKGCGTCATYCPTGAIDIRHFKDEQYEAMLKAFLTEG